MRGTGANTLGICRKGWLSGERGARRSISGGLDVKAEMDDTPAVFFCSLVGAASSVVRAEQFSQAVNV
jgi:hypothetical protein